MKTLRFKITIVLLCIGVIAVTAQKLEKKHTEKFTVNNDVVIDVNTRYTDIEIETWNKNEVIIEAYIDINGETDQKVIDDYIKSWNFEALGNKSSIKISSKSSGLIDISTFDFVSPDYDILINGTSNNLRFIMPEIPELPEFPELPEIAVFEMVEIPELPEMPELQELPETPTEFDFDAYKKDKSYLERWKKENKDIIGKNAKIKVGKNSISISSRDESYSHRWNITTEGQNELAKEIEERLEESRIYREERLKEHEKEMEERREEIKERMKEHTEERKLALIKRQEAHEIRAKEMAKHRTEVRDILAKRGKVKIKRIIKIKAPKNAKFNMNVRYGSMSFPKG